jgi:hypothetical protein
MDIGGAGCWSLDLTLGLLLSMTEIKLRAFVASCEFMVRDRFCDLIGCYAVLLKSVFCLLQWVIIVRLMTKYVVP